MATGGAYKTLGENDIVSTRTLLHEAIPITGSIVSGSAYSDNNIKNHSHGMFQTVYDYPYLSSSANHIFDVTFGVSSKAGSGNYSSLTTQQAKKKNIYNQMAQVLVGYDITGSVLDFDIDGNILAGGGKHRDVFIVPFSRLLVKDEIKKGSFSMKLGTTAAYSTPFSNITTITDSSGSDGYLVNSPAGEYGLLFANGNTAGGTTKTCGLIYYQAGICVLTASIFSGLVATTPEMNSTAQNMQTVLRGQNIQALANAFRHRLQDVTFNNTTELNSTIYFCRAHHNEFNYSTNPTYLSNSKIRVKTNASDNPVSYITTIGMYNDNNELMAVAKLSEPLKKTPDVEFTLRVRLDY
tara:strand:+ start:2298 stop:3353 length:1056 start_codon:yes stop_codon:yes gene_type:complete